jgi:hypothetical protein
MKNHIAKSLIAGAAVLALAACDYNSWNEDYLDGFETPDNTDVKTVEYTLTAADYAAVAANKTNAALAGDALKDQLANVGKLHRFTDEIPAADYMPAFLASTSFPYFSLSDGSAVKLTFNVADALPEELEKLNATEAYTLTTEDYQTIWDSEEDYADALAPSHTPEVAIPAVLAGKYPDAELGDYVVVNYNWSETDPVFNAQPTPDPGFEPTAVLGSLEMDQTVTVRGWITGVCERGYIVTDASGSVFAYYGGGIDIATYPIGAEIEVTAPVSSYNNGWQLDGSKVISETVNKNGEPYTYPAPEVLTGSKMDELITRADNELAMYVQMTGTVAVSGNNINIVVEGAEEAKGSAYFSTEAQKEMLTDGAKVTVTGYFIAVAGTRYMNTVVTDIKTGAAAPARVAQLASTGKAQAYYFNGTRWSKPNNVTALSAAQCNEITGKTYGNLTKAQADYALPIFLKQTFPYAQAGNQQFIVFNCNDVKAYVGRQYIFDGAEWAENDGIEETTLQFVRQGGSWKADPSVVLVLPSGKGQELSATYYQACTDWVYENIDVPLGSTSITSGFGYVTSYGNNEYYSGTSAYQNNVDLRADKAAAQYPEGYAGMSDAEIVALMKKRFETEVMPGVLAKLHPEAAPMEGVQVTYTITFGTYDGSNHTETIRFEVTAPGTFTFLDCTWNEE